MPRILILAVSVALLFVLAVGGYAWWITRPLSGTLAVPVARRGGTLLTAQARQPVLPENEMAFMPGILRIVSRMHRFTIHWELQASGGKPASGTGLNLKFEDAAAVVPEALVPDRILAAALPDTVAVFDLSGRKLNQFTLKGFSVRNVAASPNGLWTAWSVSLSRNTRSDPGRLSRDPYDLSMPPPPPGEQTRTFRLFIADRDLNRVREIDIAGTYPALGPGSMTWADSPALYFTGYDTDDHERRTTYRVDPRTGTVQPVAGRRDWGPVFALSPDGDTAASVDSRGLTLTDTEIGAQKQLWPGAPSERALPAWDAAGRRVAFLLKPVGGPAANSGSARRIAGKHARFVVADTVSGKFPAMSKPVENFICSPCRPVWSPDGSRLFVNGSVFEERSRGLLVLRRVVLCYDITTGTVSYPADFRGLWK